MNSEIKGHLESLKQFCQKWHIRELSLFGSALRPEEFNSESDLDFLVSFGQEASWDLFDLVTMKQELESNLGRPVDLVEKEALHNPWRRREILRTREVIYEG